MPGPVVYVVAVLAAVGTAFIFKEFVYEPHIAPFIQDYKDERRRRRQGPIPVHQHRPSSDTSDDEHRGPASRRTWFTRKGGYEDESDSELYGRPHLHKNTRGGPSIELEDLVAREAREWRSPNYSTGYNDDTHGLRQRNRPVNVEIYGLDEANERLSFAPISPSRPANASIRSIPPTSTTSPTRPQAFLGPINSMYNSVSGKQATTLSPTRTLPSPRESNVYSRGLSSPVHSPFSVHHEDTLPTSHSSPSPPSQRRFSREEVAKDLPPLPSKAAVAQPTSIPIHGSLRPIIIPSRQASTDSRWSDGVASSATSATTIRPPSPPPATRLASGLSQTSRVTDSPLSPTTLPTSAPPSLSPTASPSLRVIPSLSQSYPQDLEYEHGVVLLSPPSSRSGSPFSVLGTGEGVGSPFVSFGAVARNEDREAVDCGKSTPMSSAPHSPTGSLQSQYLSLPGSNAPSAPGSPSGDVSQLEESAYIDASSVQDSRSTSDPFVDPPTPRTPTTALDLDSDISDWEHAGVGSSPSRPITTGVTSPAPNATRLSDNEDSDDDLDAFSDSGLSEASLSSWASVSGASSNGASQHRV